MESNAPPPSAPPTPNGDSVIVAMLDSPFAQTARFVGRSAAAWLQGLIDPWGLGVAVERRRPSLPPPFACLVVALFAVGVMVRLWLMVGDAPPSAVASLLGDLRTVLGDVSLARVTFVTLPCVVVTALIGRALSLLGPADARRDDDRVVAAMCYAMAWQCGVTCVIGGGWVLLQIAGYSPAEALESVGPHTLLLIQLGLFGWSVLILAPAVRAAVRARGLRFATPVGLAASLLAFSLTAAVDVQLLIHSIDTSSAASVGLQRRLAGQDKEKRDEDLAWEVDAYTRDLVVDVLDWRPLPGGAPLAAARYEWTIAYTNRSDSLIVAPRIDTLAPAKTLWMRNRQVRSFRVARSSVDDLPDRALLIEPRKTRVVKCVVEVDRRGVLIGATPPVDPRVALYSVAYYLRGPTGLFRREDTLIAAPGELAAIRIGDAAPLGGALLK